LRIKSPAFPAALSLRGVSLTGLTVFSSRRQTTPAGISFMKRTIASLIVFGILVLLARGRVEAAPYQFGQFHIPSLGQPLSYTNNGGTSARIDALNVPVIFNFTATTTLSTADHPAFLNISPVAASSSNQAAITAGPLVDQPLNLASKLTLTSGMNGTGVDYLTMTFTGDITGFLGGPVASLLGADNNPSNPRVVTYTSDFGHFVPPTPGNSYNLALQDINPPLSIGAGGFLSSSVENVSGQFSGNFVAIPEPASAVLFGIGAISAGLVVARRKVWVNARC
jgi:hypothetical protein